MSHMFIWTPEYGAARELTASRVTPEEAEVICHGLPVPEEDVEALKRHLEDSPAMQVERAAGWLCRVTAELNDTTWMNLADDHGPPILTRRGTRPGSAFADITYGLLLRRILEFRHTMRPPESKPPRPSLHWTGERAFTPFESSSQATEQAPLVCLGDIVWADDLAACVLCPQAQDVVASVGAELLK